jgi:carboxylesterase type B
MAVFNNPPPVEDENCLYLNVFAPKKSWNPKSPPYPVLFWMYGGGWKFGNAGQPWYDGSHFAALEDVVIVTANYRTNVFGFPTSPAITNVTERNVALLDQKTGLDWVQTNIAKFGGDKDKVTIFGESAGSFAVDSLITSYKPGQPRPFHAAIMESGTYAYTAVGNCVKDFYYGWEPLVGNVSCTGANDQEKFDCVQKTISKDKLRDVQEKNPSIAFAHSCDEVTFVSDPRARLEANNVADVPVLLGTNTADGSVYTIQYFTNTVGYLNAQFTFLDQAAKDKILAAYPVNEFGNDEQLRMQQMHTDWAYHCPAVWYGETSTKFKPTYRYLFNATFANTQAATPPGISWPAKYQGAYHSSEIPIIFSSYKEEGQETGQKDLSDKMRKAWANFARNPTERPLENWPKVGDGGTAGQDVMSFGTDGKGGVGPVKDVNRCDTWKELGFREIHL